MKPPVVHQPVQPPQPNHAGTDTPVQRDAGSPPEAESPGLVGSQGPLVGGRPPADGDGAGADERKAP